MNWYSKDIKEVLAHFTADKNRGLSEAEAKKRLEATGRNRLEEKRKKGLFSKFIQQMSDFMVIILIAAAVLSLFISIIDGDADFVDPVIIIAIVLLNATMGIIQESKAEKAIESLQKLSAPKSTVLRGGQKLEIDSECIVTGDIIFFETGDCITADARIIESAALSVEESSLTGESEPALKSERARVAEGMSLGERRSMVYSGSAVVGGRCRAVVTATGMDTEVGKIAKMLDDAEPPETPLQKRLAGTGKILAGAALIMCGLVFALGIIQATDILDSFMLSVSLAVAAVPEGLPAIVTIVLALGVQRMAKKNAIVRKLPAVETLGSATVICSDKTGTLTQNKMTVQKLADNRGAVPSPEMRRKILTYGALCTNSTVTVVDGKPRAEGDPTENAIVNAALCDNISRDALEKKFPRVTELPFDSKRKLMSTVHKNPDGGRLIITKGAADVLIKICGMSDAERKTILEANSKMADKALRVIAVAYRETGNLAEAEVEKDLTFLGLIAMQDPPRPEVRDAVQTCKRAGIKPVMITGDHAATAAAIARQLGILSSDGRVLTGQELDGLTDAGLRSAASTCNVFARVSPEHKSRVVKAFQERGEIVAMTGDGVNDAPALKIADIGCAMGESGTDVARDASDMILTDDNFATIVSAVREGRGIYQNICKSVHFLLSCNVGEILTILGAFLLGMSSPLLPIQLLWINLVTDSLPALAIGAEKADGDIMDRKPVRPKSSMFADGRGLDIAVQGVMIGVLALLAFYIGVGAGDYTTGRTFSFAVLSISQLVHAFNIRSSESLFKIGFFSNPMLVGAFVICCIMQVSVICIPALSGIFGVRALTLGQWGTVALLSLLPLIAVELGKLLFGNRASSTLAKYK